MTLIAITTTDEGAEFATDTATYRPNLGHGFGHGTKTLLLPHMDAAVLASGSGTFGDQALYNLLRWSHDVDFDQLMADAPGVLANLWSQLVEDQALPTVAAAGASIFLVGHSALNKTFVAVECSHRHDFERERVAHGSLFITPTPFEYQATDAEIERFRELLTNAATESEGDNEAEIEDVLKMWRDHPPAPVPTTVTEWAVIVDMARRSRALDDFGKHPIAGRAFLTTLVPGASTTRKLLDFNDTGQELLDLVGYTHHPVSLARPCHCDSGKTFLDCHLVEILDEVCPCGWDGTTFRECCALGAEIADA